MHAVTVTETPELTHLYRLKPSQAKICNVRNNPPKKPRYKNLIEVTSTDYALSVNSLTESEEANTEVLSNKQQSFEELTRIKNDKNISPSLKPISFRAFEAAKAWMFMSYAENAFLEVPKFMLTGDGGVAFEWREDNNYVSVHFDENDSDMDMIFYRFDGERDYRDLTKTNLFTLLDRLA